MKLTKTAKIAWVVTIAIGLVILWFAIPSVQITPSPPTVPSVTPGYDLAGAVSAPAYERSALPVTVGNYSGETWPVPPQTPVQAVRWAQRHPGLNVPDRYLLSLDSPVRRFTLPADDYERVGFVYQPETRTRLPLFGRPVIPEGNRFDYYVLDDTIHTNPLGLNEFNGLELVDGDTVSISGYKGRFVVNLY